jgi:hypothetical protein
MQIAAELYHLDSTDIESVAQTGNWRRLTKVLLKRREFTPEIAAKSAHLFSVRSITGAYLQPGFVDCNGKGVYRAANPPGGALLTVWLKEFTGDEIKIEITKASGQPVANLKAPGAPGFTRLNWDLRPTKDVSIEYGGDDPKGLLPAGDYTAELSFWIAKNETKLSRRSRRGHHAALAGIRFLFAAASQDRFFVCRNSLGPLKGQSNALTNPNA